MNTTETDSIVTVVYECPECVGTGVCLGVQNKKHACVCHACDGSGRRTSTLRTFSGRKERHGVTTVHQAGTGPQGGMPYRDWLEFKPFPPQSEDRAEYCPAYWYQCVDSNKKPHWDECIFPGMFCACPHYGNKAQCWERWDREFGTNS